MVPRAIQPPVVARAQHGLLDDKQPRSTLSDEEIEAEHSRLVAIEIGSSESSSAPKVWKAEVVPSSERQVGVRGGVAGGWMQQDNKESAEMRRVPPAEAGIDAHAPKFTIAKTN